MLIGHSFGATMSPSVLICGLFVTMLCTSCQARIGFISKVEEEDLELDRQLKVLNKPPTRSFKKNGMIIDCIEIDKQPAFDHPLLRNHTIQLRPTSLPKGALTTKSAARPTKHRVGVDCPPGTVPIKRTKKEDLIRAKSLPRRLPSTTHPLHSNTQGHYMQFATTGTTVTSSQRYYGATASINVYNETVSNNQYSGAGIWIGNKINGVLNGIHYGWTVNPLLYGDTLTRTVSFWNTGNGKAGCHNILCPGFVQISRKHLLGDTITRQSVYSRDQFVMMALIYKDVKTGNWWVVENMDGEGQVPIGYWPKSLFTSLAESATEITFGGEVYSPPNEALPAMGSGHFEPPDFTKTSYIGHIQFVDAQDTAFDPAQIDIGTFIDLPQCYQAKYLGDSGTVEEYATLFGGAGGSSCS